MATTSIRMGGSNVAIGRVFERAFATIGHNLPVAIGFALLFGALPATALTWAASVVRQNAFSGSTFSTVYIVGVYVTMISSWILGWAVSALVQGVLTRATVAESEGRRASAGECIRATLPVLLPLLGLSILLAIGVAIGFILLIVPGVMLYLAWSVAAPALVEERRGVRAAFRRSWELTKGARWQVFAIVLVLYILYYLISGVFSILSFWIIGTSGIASFQDQFSFGFLMLNLVSGLIINLLWGAVQASLYVELRDWKDGPSVQNLEDVFA